MNGSDRGAWGMLLITGMFVWVACTWYEVSGSPEGVREGHGRIGNSKEISEPHRLQQKEAGPQNGQCQ